MGLSSELAREPGTGGDGISDIRGQAAMSGLERQVERGSLFTHSSLSNLARRAYETETAVLDLIDILLSNGVIDEGALTEATRGARTPPAQRNRVSGLEVALRVDKPEHAGTTVEVNCAERLHICKAACCKFSFPLSVAEVERGVIKWDLGRPYVIRHEAGGYCTHCDPEDQSCGVYDERPQVCRNYNCAGDERIWKDFENMVINQEYLDSKLVEDNPRFAANRTAPPDQVAEGP